MPQSRNMSAPLEDSQYEHALAERIKARGLLDLLRDVSAEFHASMFEVLSRTRRPTPTKARHEVWRRLRDDLEFSFNEIAALFDRDRTTVMSGIRQARARRATQANGEST